MHQESLLTALTDRQKWLIVEEKSTKPNHNSVAALTQNIQGRDVPHIRTIGVIKIKINKYILKFIHNTITFHLLKLFFISEPLSPWRPQSSSRRFYTLWGQCHRWGFYLGEKKTGKKRVTILLALTAVNSETTRRAVTKDGIMLYQWIEDCCADKSPAFCSIVKHCFYFVIYVSEKPLKWVTQTPLV